MAYLCAGRALNATQTLPTAPPGIPWAALYARSRDSRDAALRADRSRSNGAKSRGAGSGKPFEKLSISVASDIAQELRVAAIVEHRVSESALIETALRRFLDLPKADRATALEGQGRRRKAAG